MTEHRHPHSERRTRMVIYGLLVVFLVVGLLFPRVLKVEPVPEATATYEAIAGLREGSRVVLIADYQGQDSERALSALLRQLLYRNVVVVVSASQEAATSAERVSRQAVTGLRRTYGEHLIHLGWRSGGVSWLRQAAAGFAAATDRHDHAGDDLALFPLSQRLRSFVDADLAVLVWDDGQTELLDGLYLARDYGLGVVLATPEDLPQARQLWTDGRLCGLISGQRAIADYEAAVTGRGAANRYLTAMSLGTLFILLLILWSFAGGVFSRRR